MSEELAEKLDVLIKLQAAALTASLSSVKDKVLFLGNVGLQPKLISEIVGVSQNHVNVTLYKNRKATKRK